MTDSWPHVKIRKILYFTHNSMVVCEGLISRIVRSRKIHLEDNSSLCHNSPQNSPRQKNEGAVERELIQIRETSMGCTSYELYRDYFSGTFRFLLYLPKVMIFGVASHIKLRIVFRFCTGNFFVYRTGLFLHFQLGIILTFLTWIFFLCFQLGSIFTFLT